MSWSFALVSDTSHSISCFKNHSWWNLCSIAVFGIVIYMGTDARETVVNGVLWHFDCKGCFGKNFTNTTRIVDKLTTTFKWVLVFISVIYLYWCALNIWGLRQWMKMVVSSLKLALSQTLFSPWLLVTVIKTGNYLIKMLHKLQPFVCGCLLKFMLESHMEGVSGHLSSPTGLSSWLNALFQHISGIEGLTDTSRYQSPFTIGNNLMVSGLLLIARILNWKVWIIFLVLGLLWFMNLV